MRPVRPLGIPEVPRMMPLIRGRRKVLSVHGGRIAETPGRKKLNAFAQTTFLISSGWAALLCIVCRAGEKTHVCSYGFLPTLKECIIQILKGLSDVYCGIFQFLSACTS